MAVFDILPDFGSIRSVLRYLFALGIQVIIFLSVLAVLNHFVFMPIFKILRSRKKNIDETEGKTKELQEKNAILMEEYTWRMDGASQLADEKKDVAKLIGHCRADMVLAEVKRETNRDLDNVVKSADAAYAAVAPTMEKNIQGFAENIADKVLGD